MKYPQQVEFALRTPDIQPGQTVRGWLIDPSQNKVIHSFEYSDIADLQANAEANNITHYSIVYWQRSDAYWAIRKHLIFHRELTDYTGSIPAGVSGRRFATQLLHTMEGQLVAERNQVDKRAIEKIMQTIVDMFD